MSALEAVKESFTGTRGKVLILGGIAVTAYLIWTRRGAGAGTSTVSTGDTASDPYSSTSPGSPGYTGAVTSPTDQLQASGPSTNAEWVTAGTAYLSARGIGAADAYTALQHALDGDPLTTTEYNAVSLVLTALGTPPEGMPPLSHAAPSTTTTPVITRRTVVTGGTTTTSRR